MRITKLIGALNTGGQLKVREVVVYWAQINSTQIDLILIYMYKWTIYIFYLGPSDDSAHHVIYLG